MIRVLHVLGTTNLGGAESRIMDLYRHTDRSRVQFDFLVHTDEKNYKKALREGKAPEAYNKKGHFDGEIEKLGGHIYVLPRFKGYNLLSYRKAAKRFFAAHHDYSVVQGHMTSTASIYLPEAKAAGVGCTVAHTRNAGVDKGFKGIVTKLLRSSLPKKADFCFACSRLAGDKTFGGSPYTYIPNTIDTGRFVFSISDRREIRKKYNIPGDAIVIGNVARFSPQKNQRFLIEVFSKLLNAKKQGTEADKSELYLMFCGDGELKAECEEQAKRLGVSDNVIFAGNCREVEKYYSAMDIYAFPSIYEGLPGVVVEAQASGLICRISDTITDEVLLCDSAKSLSIDGKEGIRLWTKELSDIVKGLEAEEMLSDEKELEKRRKEYVEKVREAGFDVNDLAGKLMKFYLEPGEETLPE